MCINNTQEHVGTLRERRVKVLASARTDGERKTRAGKKRERPREERALLLHVFQALMEGLANETNDSEL